MCQTVWDRGHSNIDKTKILMTIGSLMKGDSIAECSNYFWHAFLKPIFGLFESERLDRFLLYSPLAEIELRNHPAIFVHSVTTIVSNSELILS